MGSCVDTFEYLTEIHPETPDLAILDIQLGQKETSLAVARELQAKSVPFLLISGMGDNNQLSSLMPSVPTLMKPVFHEELQQAVELLLAKG